MIKPEYVAKFLLRIFRDSSINSWWGNVEFKKDGRWLFFTGMLYQLFPYINAAVKFLEKLENSRLQRITALPFPLRAIKPFISGRGLSESRDIISNIYSLLERSGVNVFYNPEMDFYSGIMLYELGYDELFDEHVRSVTEKLEGAGVEGIVTIDPHTMYALKKLYRVKFEVRTYFELADGISTINEPLNLHIPCYYGRYLELSDRLREFLRKAKISYREPEYTGEMTNCCGGPVEAISPKISIEIAKSRVQELGKEKILTCCPICLANLRRAGGEVLDLGMVVE